MEAGAFNQLHHDERGFVHLTGVIDGDDVWMVKLCNGFGFLQQASAPLCFELVAGDHLHRHLALESGVEGAMDRAHTALAELVVETVAIV